MRLRNLFEAVGGTGLKLGQQLAVRIDFLPWEVCQELGKLMDSAPPIALEVVRDQIEATVGGPLETVFQTFDPEPIGSASIAVVWRATLHSGEHVAVKVRRPDVTNTIEADLRLMDWVTLVVEHFTLVRAGFFRNLRAEFRAMFEAELDFVLEANFQEMFRRLVKRDKLRWVSAPAVHANLSSADVLTTRFIEGYSCLELLERVELRDEVFAADLERDGIVLAKLGRRVFELAHWMRGESFFFHADPHPGNVIVQPGGHIVMLDFGACGFSSATQGSIEFEISRSSILEDLDHATTAVIASTAPLPAIDIQAFHRRARRVIWTRQVDLASPDAEWWENTTASMWLAFIDAAKEFNIPVNVDTLRMVRSLLLYDTLAMRLDPTLDIETFYGGYLKRAQKRSRRRQERDAHRNRVDPALEALVNAHEIRGLVEKGTFLGTQFFRTLPVDVQSRLQHGSYFAATALRLVYRAAVLLAITLVVVTVLGSSNSIWQAVDAAWPVLTHPLVVVVLSLSLWLTTLGLQQRLAEKDVG